MDIYCKAGEDSPTPDILAFSEDGLKITRFHGSATSVAAQQVRKDFMLREKMTVAASGWRYAGHIPVEAITRLQEVAQLVDSGKQVTINSLAVAKTVQKMITLANWGTRGGVAFGQNSPELGEQPPAMMDISSADVNETWKW